MDERKFLKKIREMQEKGEKISLTELKDIQKSDKTLIKEERIELDYDSDIQTLDPDEQREEENNFKEVVSKLVKFNKIKVHKENVEWSGNLIREKVDWVFSLDDAVGCYIDTTEIIQLRDETLETLKKLRGYYDVWADEWSGRLTGTPPSEDDEMEGFEGEEGTGF